jgi:hypothetical protein
MCITALPGLWIKRHFAQAIIHQNQTAVSDSEFGNTNRLRSEVKSNQARRSGHGGKGLNRNYEMPKQISTVNYETFKHVPLPIWNAVSSTGWLTEMLAVAYI